MDAESGLKIKWRETFEAAIIYAQAYNANIKALKDIARKAQLTTLQMTALSALSILDNPMTITEIARLTQVDTQTVSKMIDQLESRRLVSRRRSRSTNDKRNVHAVLTLKGKEKVREFGADLETFLKSNFSNFSSRQIKLFNRQMREMRDRHAAWLAEKTEEMIWSMEVMSNFRKIEKYRYCSPVIHLLIYTGNIQRGWEHSHIQFKDKEAQPGIQIPA
jgi:DNA-binding MarR family transcriptional regulator